MTGPARSSHELILARTRSLSRGVLNGVREAEAAVAHGLLRRKEAQAGQLEAAANRLRARAADNLESAKLAESQIRQVDEAVRQSAQSLSKLQHSRYAQHGALKVCERRLELRENCPGIDPSSDYTHQALHYEWQTLSFARHDLLALEWEVKLALESLQAMRSCLSQDFAKRKHAAELCRSNIVSAQQAAAHGQTGGGHLSDAHGEAAEDKSVLLRAMAMLAAAEGLGSRCTEVVQRTGRECRTAATRTESSLQQRVAEVEEAGKNLRKQACEVDYTIALAERSLTQASKKLDVSGRASQIDSTKALLEELRLARQNLQVEIQQKFSQLTIDESCRKVTPQSASGVETNVGGAERRRPATAGGKVRRPESAATVSSLGSDAARSLRVLPPLSGENGTGEAQEPLAVEQLQRPHAVNGASGHNRAGHKRP